MKIMLTNSDKPWRCPAWSGSLMKNGPDSSICDGGSTAVYYSDHSSDWKYLYKPHWVVIKCPTCGTYILPHKLSRLAPSEWAYNSKKTINRLKRKFGKR